VPRARTAAPLQRPRCIPRCGAPRASEPLRARAASSCVGRVFVVCVPPRGGVAVHLRVRLRCVYLAFVQQHRHASCFAELLSSHHVSIFRVGLPPPVHPGCSNRVVRAAPRMQSQRSCPRPRRNPTPRTSLDQIRSSPVNDATAVEARSEGMCTKMGPPMACSVTFPSAGGVGAIRVLPIYDRRTHLMTADQSA